MPNIKAFISIVGLFTFLIAQAQTSVNTSGKNIISSQGQISFTIGQVFFNTNSGGDYIQNEGVQQPLVMEKDDNTDTKNNIKVFPNPSKSYFRIEIAGVDSSQYSYELIDINGKLLDKKKIELGEAEIPSDKIDSGVYLLRVFREGIHLKSFELVKIKM